jgi:CBS domain-containing protein
MSGPLASDLLRPYLVEDVMTSAVYTARPEESLLSAAETMRRHHVSGLPVVDARRRLVGVLSEKDIVRAVDRQTGVVRARGILDVLLASLEPGPKDRLHESVAVLLNGLVRDAMSHPAVSVEANDSFGEASRLLGKYSVNRLPVVREGTLVGIVTRQDVLRILHGAVPAASPPRRRPPRASSPPA